MSRAPRTAPARRRAGFPAALLLAATLLAMLSSAAAAQPADTTKRSRKPLFTSADVWVAGGFVLGTVAMLPLDRRIAEQLQDSTTQTNRFFSNAATGFRVISQPGAYIIGGSLYAIGRVGGNERMADLGLHGSEAVFFATAGTWVLKGLAGRARPYVAEDTVPGDFSLGRGFREGHDYSSFPSGHTATAFAAAAAVTGETSRWWPRSTPFIAPVMYGGATMVGLSRMFNNRHWASDVVLGAAVGTFAGFKVVRYHHSHPGNAIDRILLHVSAAPDGRGGWMVLGRQEF
jgi:membrane-associated phospholipid phosphatase